MRGDELLDVLEYIDPVLIEEADRKPRAPWLRWTAAADDLPLCWTMFTVTWPRCV